jgi:hypothetical protein
MPYVIRNCPARYLSGVCADRPLTFCEEYDNCPIKQIVELCKQYKEDYNTTNEGWLLANNITNLLYIQEVE